MLKLKKYFKDNSFNHEINLFRGYKDVFDNFEFILKILQNKNVPLEETNIKVKVNEDIDEWNYIRNQEDVNSFMRIFVGFHDSTLIINDESVFWEDDELENEDYNYMGTYIKALNLKWRKINNVS
ncbi:hypothetical protein [Terrisporobacter vanillatitrophus]|uniref:hypothetical protein n=1 Tax=Terrisporobacter vanillatitrophus TaxID=3058402 RepID=UPI003367159C